MIPIRRGPLTPWSFLLSQWALVVAVTRRDLAARYRGSVFGVLWSLITPLIMLMIFYVVFTKIFEPRWQVGEGKASYTFVLFSGMLIFQFLSDCITRAPGIIHENASFVKKVVFPVEILPAVVVFSSLINSSVGLIALVLGCIAVDGIPPMTALLFPLVLLPYMIIIAGISWLLAGIGVYIRDIGQVMGAVSTGLMFMSGVFYPVESLPVPWRFLVYLSPATLPIAQVRDLLFWGKVPDLMVWLGYWVVALLIAWLGFSVFTKLRSGFADVV